MRFQVPQFIEVEDKIFGPFTFKQFIYLAGGVGAAVVLYTLLPKFLAILLALPILVFAAALTFYKPNDKPFIHLVEAFFNYTLTNKLYIWKKEDKPINNRQETMNNKPLEQVYVPKLSESKLKDLSWSLDIKENRNPVTQDSDSLTNN
ncbi:MAG: PrgI family protein [bacterium]|nr:PrgI family protein [bacterium]